MLSRFIALCEAEGREYRVAEDMLVLPLESSQVAIRLEEHSMTITGAWEKYFPMSEHLLATEVVNAWNRDNRILKAFTDEYDVDERLNLHFYASLEVPRATESEDALWAFVLSSLRMMKVYFEWLSITVAKLGNGVTDTSSSAESLLVLDDYDSANHLFGIGEKLDESGFSFVMNDDDLLFTVVDDYDTAIYIDSFKVDYIYDSVIAVLKTGYSKDRYKYVQDFVSLINRSIKYIKAFIIESEGKYHIALETLVAKIENDTDEVKQITSMIVKIHSTVQTLSDIESSASFFASSYPSQNER
ncbi:hypothetical protein ACFQY8_00445 [Alloscardovia venturai]|uniref:Uncharacterized protein n=1 Tax=Alloscardovia venturai TaxID=1769421 RepID=A0ABW2Y1U8_9BIFI